MLKKSRVLGHRVSPGNVCIVYCYDPGPGVETPTLLLISQVTLSVSLFEPQFSHL